jgi:hypothetical protein
LNTEITMLQSTIFEMFLSGSLNGKDFGILDSITENMESDSNALEISVKLTAEHLRDDEIIDCITARRFYTALIIMGEEVAPIGIEVNADEIGCPF